MQRVLIAGGSGFLGRSLARHLHAAGKRVIVLSRSKLREEGPWEHESWDGRTVGPWAERLRECEAIVNLAGRTVDCIKTADHRDEILRSRVESTRALGEACAQTGVTPRVWVQMSTAHIYGDPPTARCTESSPFGYGLAPDVGRAWEAEFERVRPEGTRAVVLRTSFVIGKGGGALARLSALARLGLGGTVGPGTQGMSWIHERDMNRLFERAIDNDAMAGPYIASGPNPVSNRAFMRTLRKALGVPIGLPAFAWMVRIGAPLFLRTDPELALYGRYVVSERLEAEGFAFDFPQLEGAMADLV